MDVIEPWLADGGVKASVAGVMLTLLDGTTARFGGTPEIVGKKLSAAQERVDGLLSSCCPACVGPSDVRRALVPATIWSDIRELVI